MSAWPMDGPSGKEYPAATRASRLNPGPLQRAAVETGPDRPIMTGRSLEPDVSAVEVPRNPRSRMSSPQTERVLVVPGAELDRLGRFQGFSGEAERYLRALLVPGLAGFRPRSEVEDDPGFKQIIPYVVFRCGDSVFCYTRGKSQGEARLHR